MTDLNMLTAGIDTAKNKLDLAVHGSPVRLTCENQPAGWRRLARELARLGVGRIGIEATGGYERGIVGHLRKAGFNVLVLQPLQTKAFARLHLRRAKNDAIDAVSIAACTALIEPPDIPPDHRMAGLADHLTFVEQIQEDIARAKVRREHIHDARLLRMVDADIARLAKRADTEVERIARAIKTHHDLARRLELVLSVPGIGLKTAIAIIVPMPEIGRITREQAAALAGLAPFDDDSGQRKGQRHIAGGRSRLRRAIYAAALPAAFRWNTALIQLYKRLIARGKKHQQALVACARKLIVFANTVVQRDAPWVIELQTT